MLNNLLTEFCKVNHCTVAMEDYTSSQASDAERGTEEEVQSTSRPSRKLSKASRNSKSHGSSSKIQRKSSRGGRNSKSGASSNSSKSKPRLVVSIPISRTKHSANANDNLPPRKKKSTKRRFTSKPNGGGALKRKNGKMGAEIDTEDAVASSGDEYTTDLFNTYIGQVGGCVAMGLTAGDVLNLDAWNNLAEDERESLRQYLPQGLSRNDQDDAVHRLLGGESLHFGSPRDRIFEDIAAGLTHPRARRWHQRVNLIERRQNYMALKDHQNQYVRRLQAWKACKESSVDALAGLAAIGGNLTKPGGPLLALPNLVQVTAEAAVASGLNDWDKERWTRVLDFRNQETERYDSPEHAYVFHNPWGTSIVGPLKRGPALDGGRPREHPLLRNERPSHVTILCIVRDAASRLPNSRGTRSDICELLRDSQYLRDGASFAQLNQCVSGALDRLHYEKNAPVRFDPETKEWCYLHNSLGKSDFDVPDWVKEKHRKSRG